MSEAEDYIAAIALIAGMVIMLFHLSRNRDETDKD